MKSVNVWLLGVLVLALGIVIGLQVGLNTDMFNAPGNASSGQSSVAASNKQSTDAGSPEAKTSEQDSGDAVEKLDLDYMERVVANINENRRDQILEDSELFRQLVEQEATQRSLKAAALDNNMQENSNVQFLMERSKSDVLRNAYLNQLMVEQFPPDFPSEQQVREFYNNNTERFKVGERVQVWQIFLPAPENATDVEQQARDLLSRIRQDEISFEQAAVQYSEHASTQNDGYMGAVQVSQLKPAVADALKNINQDELEIAQSEDGWHILRKGRTLPEQQLAFEEAQQQARQLLVNQARQQFRRSIMEQARESYPYMPATDRISEWRQQLNNAGNDSSSANEG